MGEALPGTPSNFEIGISVAATLEGTPPPPYLAGGLGIKVNLHC